MVQATVHETDSLVRPGAQFEMLVSTFGGDAVALGSAIMPIEAMINHATPSVGYVELIRQP